MFTSFSHSIDRAERLKSLETVPNVDSDISPSVESSGKASLLSGNVDRRDRDEGVLLCKVVDFEIHEILEQREMD